MKRKIFIISLITIFIMFKSFSQGFWNSDPPKNPPRDRVMENIQIIKQQLNLTEDQVKKIENLTIETREKIQIKHLEIQKIMISIREEMLKENPNLDTINSLLEKKHKIEAEIDFLTIKRDLDIKAILSPEQFSKWQLLIGRRKMMPRTRGKEKQNRFF